MINMGNNGNIPKIFNHKTDPRLGKKRHYTDLSYLEIAKCMKMLTLIFLNLKNTVLITVNACMTCCRNNPSQMEKIKWFTKYTNKCTINDLKLHHKWSLWHPNSAIIFSRAL